MAFDIPDLLSSDQSTILRPSITLTFGGGGDSGGIGGALGDVASAVGLSSAAPGLADRLIALRITRGLAPEVDWAEFFLLPEGDAPVAPGDAGTIAMAAGDVSSSFACTIDTVEQQGHGLLRVTASNGGRILAQSRVSRSFANQDPGAIIADLARLAGIDTTISAQGASLPRYITDDRRSLHDHIARLAATAGRLAGFDDEGQLVLFDDTATGEAVATFAQGENLLDMRLAQRLPHAGASIIDGAGAADAGGGNAWAWLRKEVGPMRVSSGDGPPQRRGNAPWLTSAQGVADIAGARSRADGRLGAASRLLVQGAPQVTPGAVIAVKGSQGVDGPYLVTRVVYRFDSPRGLTAEISAAPLGGSGAAAGLGGLL